MDRMTWIKPSFLWMMYRSGWADKPGQTRILAIDILRSGFDWALGHACLSHYDPALHASYADWSAQLLVAPVRIQWDPERDLKLAPLTFRTIQVGLGPEAVRRYVNEWVSSIQEVTALAREIRELVQGGNLEEAESLLPVEKPYPNPEAVGR